MKAPPGTGFSGLEAAQRGTQLSHVSALTAPRQAQAKLHSGRENSKGLQTKMGAGEHAESPALPPKAPRHSAPWRCSQGQTRGGLSPGRRTSTRLSQKQTLG